MQPLDRTVLESARNGDRRAFAVIVRTHFRFAYATALAVVSDPTDAEDVVQDAFVRCWQRLEQCRSPSSFAGWLRSLVRHVALNHLERERVRATRPLETVNASSPSRPDVDLDRRILGERLLDGMRSLTDVQREILLLYDLEGYRHADIARLLGISELMSRKHISHARRRMRRVLEEQEPRRASL